MAVAGMYEYTLNIVHKCMNIACTLLNKLIYIAYKCDFDNCNKCGLLETVQVLIKCIRHKESKKK